MANLKTEMNAILQSFGAERDEVFMEVEQGVAQEGAEKLRQTSPKRRGGRGKYARGWTYKKTKSGFVIHNKTDYQLTHLLENGHAVVNAKGDTGKRADAHKHIEPVYLWAQGELEREVRQRIERGGV